MIAEITKFLDEMDNARNHGHNGSNWWYPVPNRIAYDIKLSHFVDADDLRKHMTEKQKLYYTDDEKLNEIIWEQVYEMASITMDDIKSEYYAHVDDVNIAGRSGGWMEVTYNINSIPSDVTDEPCLYTAKEVTDIYKDMKKIQHTMDCVQSTIEMAVKYCNNVDEFSRDIHERLSDDDEINEMYAMNIERAEHDIETYKKLIKK